MFKCSKVQFLLLTLLLIAPLTLIASPKGPQSPKGEDFSSSNSKADAISSTTTASFFVTYQRTMHPDQLISTVNNQVLPVFVLVINSGDEGGSAQYYIKYGEPEDFWGVPATENEYLALVNRTKAYLGANLGSEITYEVRPESIIGSDELEEYLLEKFGITLSEFNARMQENWPGEPAPSSRGGPKGGCPFPPLPMKVLELIDRFPLCFPGLADPYYLVECVYNCPPGRKAYFYRGDRKPKVYICPNNLNNQNLEEVQFSPEEALVHELNHLLDFWCQWLPRDGPLCETSVKTEYKAYYCAQKCSSPGECCDIMRGSSYTKCHRGYDYDGLYSYCMELYGDAEMPECPIAMKGECKDGACRGSKTEIVVQGDDPGCRDYRQCGHRECQDGFCGFAEGTGTDNPDQCDERLQCGYFACEAGKCIRKSGEIPEGEPSPRFCSESDYNFDLEGPREWAYCKRVLQSDQSAPKDDTPVESL